MSGKHRTSDPRRGSLRRSDVGCLTSIERPVGARNANDSDVDDARPCPFPDSRRPIRPVPRFQAHRPADHRIDGRLRHDAGLHQHGVRARIARDFASAFSSVRHASRRVAACCDRRRVRASLARARPHIAKTIRSGRTATMAWKTDDLIVQLAGDQHGIVTRAQLLERGITTHDVTARVRRGRFGLVHRGVYAVGPLRSPCTKRWRQSLPAVRAPS
jgi:hypothetical protein